MKTTLSDSFPAALELLAARLRARKFAPDEYHIVITPDRYTLQTEKALFGGGGALDCEVLTLSRLCRRVCGAYKSLSREGGVMLVARAVAEVKDKLKYYGKSARFYDFARDMYDTILQISASGVAASGIAASGVVATKLADIALITEKYEALKEESKDAADRMTELIAAAPSSALICSSHFYAVGFSHPTALNKQALRAIAENARSFEFFDAAPPEPRESMEVYSAPDRITEYKAVASRIRELVFKGSARYGDISVICPDPKPLARILREYGILFYADISTPLAQTPPLCALYDIHKLVASAEADRVISLCKNPFSGCSPRDAEKLQVCLNERGIRHNCFDAQLGDVEAMRALDRARELVGMFEGRFAAACEAVIAGGDFEGVQAALYRDDTDMITPIRSLLALLSRYGGDETDAAAFFSAANSLEVKSLPRSKDRVNVVMPQSLRMTACEYLFVTDFNEGSLPAVTADSGLLSDGELTALGGVIEPTAREKNRRDRDELYAVMSNAHNLFCSYHTSDGAKPSIFLGEYAESVGAAARARVKNTDAERERCAKICVRETSYDEERAVLAKETEAVGFIAKFASVPAAARELAARRLSPLWRSVENAVKRTENISPPFSAAVDGISAGKLSVSELTHWFDCPYKRFLVHSVGLTERRDGSLSAPDFGIIVHEFMRRFVSDGMTDDSIEYVTRVVDEILPDDLYITEADRERIIFDAADYAALNKRIIEAGEYRPAETEKRFSGEIKLGSRGQSELVGVIDRVDRYGGDARIIDYKTGDKKFDLADCLNGRDMQLPLYAAARRGAENVTGMFYIPLRGAYSKDGTRMAGCMVRDVDVAEDFDRGLAVAGTRSEIVQATVTEKDGARCFSRPSVNLLPERAFDRLIDACVRTANVAADEIDEGYIARSPADGACERCAFGAICGYGKEGRE